MGGVAVLGEVAALGGKTIDINIHLTKLSLLTFPTYLNQNSKDDKAGACCPHSSLLSSPLMSSPNAP